jgi:hypothetical protein
VLDGMYPSRPRWEFLALNFFGMMLAIAMLTERTRLYLGNRVREYRSCSAGFTRVRVYPGNGDARERTWRCLSSRVLWSSARAWRWRCRW